MKSLSAVHGFLQEKEGHLALLHYTLSLRVVGVDCFIISRKGVKEQSVKPRLSQKSQGLGLSSAHPLPAMLCRGPSSACYVLDICFLPS